MQQLHLVGFTTDLEGLIFSARKGAKSGGYLVVLDDKLHAAIEDALRLRDGHAPGDVVDDEGAVQPRPRRPRPQSTLSPREIQARLRTGSTIAEVAEEAGVDEEWVTRFALPILAEQAQVVGRARRLTFVKARLGESAQPLGVAVRWNLADKDIRMLDDDYDAAWSAYNLQGTSWVVRFQYVSRQKRHVAEWEVDLRESQLFARNRTASDLGYVDPARRRRRPPVLEPSPRDTPARPVDAAEEAGPDAGERGSDAGGRKTNVPIVDVRVPRSAKANATPAASGAGRPARAAKQAAKQSTKRAGKQPAKGAASATGAARGGAASSRAGASRGGTGGRSAAGRAVAGRVAVSRSGAAKGAGKKAAGGKSTAARSTAAKAKSGSGRTTATKGAAKRGRASGRASDASGPDPAAAPPRLEEPVRPSHLARPPSPMPMARRATTAPFPASRPAPPPPRRAPAPPAAPARAPAAARPDADDNVYDELIEAPAPRRPAPTDRAAAPDAAGTGGRTPAGAPRPAPMSEGVRVLDGVPGDNGGPARLPRPASAAGRPPAARPAPEPTRASDHSASPAPTRAAERSASPRSTRAADRSTAGPATPAARTPASDVTSGRRLPADAPPPQGDPIELDEPGPARGKPRSAQPSPEQRLARRLAAGGARARGDAAAVAAEPAPPPGRTPAPAATSAPSPPRTRNRNTGAPPAADEALWHGPGSGDPAPPVRIRADLAAGTIRPTETPEPPPSPAQARAARERPLRARPEGRRERPLRAR